MSPGTDGTPERLGRLLGRAVVQGRVAARQVADPATREQLAEAGRRVAERAQPQVQRAASRIRAELGTRGPDVAEQVTQRAVDRVLWGLGGRFGILAVVIRPLAQPVRTTAGTLARELAKAAGGDGGAATRSAAEGGTDALPEAADEDGAGPGTKEPPAPST